MPVYTFRCKECNKDENRFLLMEECSNIQVCLKCEKDMSRVFKSPQIHMGFQPWYDIGDNRWINSKGQQEEIIKRENKVLGGHEDLIKEAQKNKKRNKKEFEEKSGKELMDKLSYVLD